MTTQKQKRKISKFISIPKTPKNPQHKKHKKQKNQDVQESDDGDDFYDLTIPFPLSQKKRKILHYNNHDNLNKNNDNVCYILWSKTHHRTYTGWTNNQEKRFLQHTGKLKNGAKSIRGRNCEPAITIAGFHTPEHAMQFERALKKTKSRLSGPLKNMKEILQDLAPELMKSIPKSAMKLPGQALYMSALSLLLLLFLQKWSSDYHLTVTWKQSVEENTVLKFPWTKFIRTCGFPKSVTHCVVSDNLFWERKTRRERAKENKKENNKKRSRQETKRQENG